MITLTFDDLEKIKKLDRFDNRRVCFDYVDSLSADGDIFQVTVFVEPAGLVTRRGKSWAEVLDWWIKAFDTQPENIHSQIYGWHLMGLYQKDFLPDDPADCWNGLDKSELAEDGPKVRE